MSASPHSFPKLPRGPLPHGADVLGELLHSLSQPLTSLRCSLELSIEDVTERQQESVAAALQQTEKVIGMIQLMREYLDAEQPGPETCSSALAPALRSVIEELSSIAGVRGIQLRLMGACTATLPVPESRLRLALQYLIAAMMEAQPAGGKVMLMLGEAGGSGAAGGRRTRFSRAGFARSGWGNLGICSNAEQGEAGDRQPCARNRRSGAGVRRGRSFRRRSHRIRAAHSAPGWRSCPMRWFRICFQRRAGKAVLTGARADFGRGSCVALAEPWRSSHRS